MRYAIKHAGDRDLLESFDECRRREVTYKHKHLGVVTQPFKDATEYGRAELVEQYAHLWTTDQIERQLEALTNDEILQKDIMLSELSTLISEAKKNGEIEEFMEWFTWHRDMRTLHRILAHIFKTRLEAKSQKYTPVRKKRNKFLEILGF